MGMKGKLVSAGSFFAGVGLGVVVLFVARPWIREGVPKASAAERVVSDPNQEPAVAAEGELSGEVAKMLRDFSGYSSAELLAYRKTLESNPKLQADFDANIMPKLAERDPVAALEYLESGEQWKGQWDTEKAAYKQLIDSDPLRIVQRFETIENPHDGFKAWGMLAIKTLGEKEPEVGVNYFHHLPDEGGIRKLAYEKAMHDWASRNPLTASQYLTELPKGKDRDYAVGAFAGVLRLERPADAFVWAASIDDPELRQFKMGKAMESWMNQGGFGAARTAIQEAVIPGAERERLLKMLP